MSTLTAKDVMTTEVITVRADCILREVAEILTSNRISGAPVVDADGKLVGVISESDLLDEDKRRDALPRSALYGATVIPEKLLLKAYENGLSLKVWDLMTSNVVKAFEDTTVDELTDMMLRHKINRIPIVKDGKPVGIVTRTDLLRGLLRSES